METRPDTEVSLAMKKLVSLLAACLLLFSCALAEPETVDLEAMTLSELAELKARVDAAILQAAAAQDKSEYAATQADPVPVGAAARYDGSSYMNQAVTDIAITEVIRGDAAWRKVRSWNSYNARPADGEEYIIVTVKAEAVAAPENVQAQIYDYDFTFISAEGAEYEYAYAAGIDKELANLYAGASCEGYVVGLIKKGDSPLLVYLKDSDAPLWFDLNRHAPVGIEEGTVPNPLKRGDIGEDVRAMQQALIGMSYLGGSADGNFGQMTEAAVRAYQADMGLDATGIADEATLRLILSCEKPE